MATIEWSYDLDAAPEDFMAAFYCAGGSPTIAGAFRAEGELHADFCLDPDDIYAWAPWPDAPPPPEGKG